MKTILIDGKLCVGPHFTETEFVMMRKNLSQQKLLDILGELLNSVGNPVRIKIVYLLFAHKELCVCDLAELLKISDSAVSQHLRKLKDKQIVFSRKKAQSVYYSLQKNAFVNKLMMFFNLKYSENKYELISK